MTVYQFLESAHRKDYPSFTIGQARSGVPTATLANRSIHSAFDPIREAQRFAGSITEREGDVLVFFGFGLGYHMEAVRAAHPGLPIVVVEPIPPLLQAALDDGIVDRLSGISSVEFVHGDDEGSLVRLFQNEGYHSPKLVPLPAYGAAFPEEWERLSHFITSYTHRSRVNRNTLKRFGRLWVRNILRNSMNGSDALPLTSLRGIHEGMRALVCGAGPTLDEDPVLLSQLAERCVVIAVDTAVPRLEQLRIPVDLVVSVDPQYWNTRHVERIMNRTPVLVTEPAVHPRVLRLWNGPVVMAESVFPLGRVLTGGGHPDSRLGAGGSVATTAWDLARFTGCSTVFLSGVDLGFPHLQTHCRDSYFENRLRSHASRRVPATHSLFGYLYSAGAEPVPAADGDTVLSDQRMVVYREWFREQVSPPSSPKTFFLSGRSSAIDGITTYPGGKDEEIAFHRPQFSRLLDRRLSDSRHTRGGGIHTEDVETSLHELAGLADSIVETCERLLRQRSVSAEDLHPLNTLEADLLSHEKREIVGFLISETVDTVLSQRASTLKESVSQSHGIADAVRQSARYHISLMHRYGLISR